MYYEFKTSQINSDSHIRWQIKINKLLHTYKIHFIFYNINTLNGKKTSVSSLIIQSNRSIDGRDNTDVGDDAQWSIDSYLHYNVPRHLAHSNLNVYHIKKLPVSLIITYDKKSKMELICNYDDTFEFTSFSYPQLPDDNYMVVEDYRIKKNNINDNYLSYLDENYELNTLL